MLHLLGILLGMLVCAWILPYVIPFVVLFVVVLGVAVAAACVMRLIQMIIPFDQRQFFLASHLETRGLLSFAACRLRAICKQC